VGRLLVQLGTHRHRRFAERLALLDLQPRHFGMLCHLAANEGQSQQALSRALGIHRSAMVALVDDLKHRGLAERCRDPDDRCAYTLYMTPPGRELLAELQRVAEEDEAELLTALNASERSQLISLLQRVAESQGLTGAFIPTWNREKATITQPRKTARLAPHALGERPAEGTTCLRQRLRSCSRLQRSHSPVVPSGRERPSRSRPFPR
jgi:DNA-binding MarR family transcriptional regulator